MKAGSEGIAPYFLTSALDGGKWSASHPGRLTHWMGGSMSLRNSLVLVVSREGNTRHVTILTELSRIFSLRYCKRTFHPKWLEVVFNSREATLSPEGSNAS
jgi:hypothetical protein